MCEAISNNETKLNHAVKTNINRLEQICLKKAQWMTCLQI